MGFYVTCKRPRLSMPSASPVIDQAIMHDRCRIARDNTLRRDLRSGEIFMVRFDSMLYGTQMALHRCMLMPSTVGVHPNIKPFTGSAGSRDPERISLRGAVVTGVELDEKSSMAFLNTVISPDANPIQVGVDIAALSELTSGGFPFPVGVLGRFKKGILVATVIGRLNDRS